MTFGGPPRAIPHDGRSSALRLRRAAHPSPQGILDGTGSRGVHHVQVTRPIQRRTCALRFDCDQPARSDCRFHTEQRRRWRTCHGPRQGELRTGVALDAGEGRQARVRPRGHAALAGGDRFWYTFENSSGRKFYLVDPAKKTKTLVYDPTKLAAALTTATGLPYDSQHLPITTFRFVKGEQAIQFELNVPRDANIPGEKKTTGATATTTPTATRIRTRTRTARSTCRSSRAAAAAALRTAAHPHAEAAGVRVRTRRPTSSRCWRIVRRARPRGRASRPTIRPSCSRATTTST